MESGTKRSSAAERSLVRSPVPLDYLHGEEDFRISNTFVGKKQTLKVPVRQATPALLVFFGRFRSLRFTGLPTRQATPCLGSLFAYRDLELLPSLPFLSRIQKVMRLLGLIRSQTMIEGRKQGKPGKTNLNSE